MGHNRCQDSHVSTVQRGDGLRPAPVSVGWWAAGAVSVRIGACGAATALWWERRPREKGQHEKVDADGHSREKFLARARFVFDTVRRTKQGLGHIARHTSALGLHALASASRQAR